MTDTYVGQIGGAHYQSPDQHWDLMPRWDIEYLPATASKYVVRYDKKGKPKEDLEKAISYLEKQLALRPLEGCRRTMPVTAMKEWLAANPMSLVQQQILILVHCYGSPNQLRTAIQLIKETIYAGNFS